MVSLEEKLSFATCLMQLKNLACNYFGVACNMCSCMRHFSTSYIIMGFEQTFQDLKEQQVVTHTKFDKEK